MVLKDTADEATAQADCVEHVVVYDRLGTREVGSGDGSDIPWDDDRDELRELVDEGMGTPFRPREVPFVEEFPKTRSGKILRRAIASVYRGRGSETRRASRTSTRWTR